MAIATIETIKNETQNVDWKATSTVNLIRAFFSGLVLMVIALLSGALSSMGPQIFALPVAIPLFFLIAMPIIRVFQKVSFMKWVNLVFVLMFIFGDPLVFILHKLVPQAVPIDKYNFINVAALIYVRKS